MRAALCWAVASLPLGLVSACRSVPDQVAAPTGPAHCRDLLLDTLGSYAVELRQMDDAALAAEKERLDSLPQSPDRDLRLALVLGRPTSTARDPEAASRLLADVGATTPADSVYKALAELLFSSMPGAPGSCADSDEVRELASQLSVEQLRRQEMASRLESLRQELEAERAQREKLEQQLDALKSLEEQIKNRDNGSGR